MAIYRFRVSFEDYDDVVREIDIKSNQTFLDLHKAIHAATNYDAEKSSSFYVSNDQWIKNDEIAYLPSQRKIDRGVVLMNSSKLSKYIDDPHQKFYYVYNFDRPFDFHVELIKIVIENDDKAYPLLVRSQGEIPKLPGTFNPTVISSGDEEFDFLNEMDFAPEDTEELEAMTDMGINSDESDDTEDEKDEIMDEFSDNENYDEEDYQKDE